MPPGILLTIHQFFQLLYSKKKDQKIDKLAINNTSLPEAKRERLKKFLAQKKGSF